jgi:TonB family protein
MKSLEVTEISKADSKILVRCAFLALAFEFIFLTLIGIQEHWLAHPQATTGLDSTKFIDAEVFQIPKESHLMEDKKIKAPAVKEKAISTTVDRGTKEKSHPDTKAEEKNQTDAGTNIAANHGPVAIVAPPPVIPSHLQDQDINTSVVIEFLVNNQGVAVPRLIGSSGNEELDAIALKTVRQWQFKPAEQNHKPIDAKIRLRINFQVH